jgi:hypothetical protein
MMAVVVDQYIQPQGYLAVFVITKGTGLLFKLVAKGGKTMATKIGHALKHLVAAGGTITLSRITC